MEPSFDTLLLDLSSDRWNARRAAARGLGELGDHQAVEPLLERLRVEDWVSVRSALVDALRQLCDARDVPRLVEALPALAEDAQEGVIALLGDLRDARAVPALLKFVRSMGRRELKAELGELLERMRREARTKIQRTMSDGYSRGRLEAEADMLELMIERGNEIDWRIDWNDLIDEMLPRERRGHRQRHADKVYSLVAAALRQIGRETTPMLAVALHDSFPTVVRLAAEVLAEVGDGRALPDLRAALRPWKLPLPRPDVKKAIQEAINAVETRLAAYTGHELELVELAPAAAIPTGRELTPAGNGRCAIPSAVERMGRELEETEEPPAREA